MIDTKPSINAQVSDPATVRQTDPYAGQAYAPYQYAADQLRCSLEDVLFDRDHGSIEQRGAVAKHAAAYQMRHGGMTIREVAEPDQWAIWTARFQSVAAAIVIATVIVIGAIYLFWSAHQIAIQK